ncbi:MAG TPA: TonB-dependent receptor [Caulobacteraceae bacterium]|nr:TonB-dependent receptor [Caulobacteraceae bacterium]
MQTVRRNLALCGASGLLLAAAAGPLWAAPAGQSAAPAPSATVQGIVVTAEKREENINNVGMSVQAASGQQLVRLGITDTSQLVKIIPGFNYSPSFYGTPIYSIRGIGFLDTSLAASPTVSVYVDQMPLPYSILTTGTTLDLQRVEVLKGPQGTLFGENATGGAINYIANKPTDTFKAGVDASYGRFNTVDLQGFVSGPIAKGLDARIALHTAQSGDWQQSYTHPASWGAQNLINGRAAVLWKPTDNFRALLTVSSFLDRSDTQMPQMFGVAVLSPVSGLDPRIFSYPRAPHNDRAADWSACVNDSPFDPPFDTTPIGATKPTTSTACIPARNDNTFWDASLRMDYDLPHQMVLTSLSSYENFHRHAAIEGDGTIYQDYESLQLGHIISTYQELRLAGKFAGRGSWIVGGNYELDRTWDNFLQTYGGSTANPTAIPGASLCAIPGFCTGVPLAGVPLFYLTTLGPTRPVDRQRTTVWAGFGDVEYPITEALTLEGGVRFTQTDKNFHGCGNDGGDGTWAAVSQQIQDLLEVLNGAITPAQYLQPGLAPGGNGINVGPGGCGTTGPGPSFHPQPFDSKLNENNVSWRAGVNWKPAVDTLLYANVSQGWKSGSFPTVATSAYTQLRPAVQEGLLAYEVGFKAGLLRRTLQLNGALFYYDYKNKQILGAVIDPVFGPLPALVNVPNSHVAGFELSANWLPMRGLTISPGVSYTQSRVDTCAPTIPECAALPAGGSAPAAIPAGHYHNFDPFSQNVDLTGEPFPADPQWQADVDAEYDWPLTDALTAFVGANVNYQSDTNGFFYNRAPFPAQNAQPPHILDIPSHTLLDLRAGVESGAWRFQVWGRNVTNTYYWTTAAHVNDVLVRYTGMPVIYGVTVSYRYH